jgi:hypothetical protein
VSDLYIAVYRRALSSGWPYDLGDDPAFQASEKRNSDGRLVATNRITWGVCRPNVRNPIQPNSLVVFFAVGRHAPFQYEFVGFATVEKKVLRNRVWKDRELAPYRCYRNLLVLPESRGFRHVEFPHFGQRVWHPDWLSRVLNPSQRHHADFRALQKSGFLPDNARIGGVQVMFAENYVLFYAEGTKTFVAANPPVVAEAAKNGMSEVWKKDSFSQHLRRLVFNPGGRDYLRSRHRQIPHTHIKIENVDIETIRSELVALCSRFGLKPRIGSIADQPAIANSGRRRWAKC